MKKTKLNPCPFCNSTVLRSDRMLGSNRFYHVMCTSCGALGPLFEEYDSYKKGYNGAIELWNKRDTTFNHVCEQ